MGFDPQLGIKLLLSAFESVHRRHLSSLSFEELYRAAYLLTINRHAETFLDALSTFLSSTFADRASIALASSQQVSAILQEASAAEITIQHVAQVLMYLDKNFKPPVSNTGANPQSTSVVRLLGQQKFRDSFLCHPGVLQRLQTWLHAALMQPLSSDRDLLREMLKMCHWTGTYENIFESVYLRAVKEKALIFAQNPDISEYVAAAHALLEEQRFLCKSLELHPTTEKQMLNTLDLLIVVPFMQTIYADGVRKLLLHYHLDAETVNHAFRQMYDLGVRLSEAMTMAGATIKAAIVAEVEEVLNSSNEANQTVTKLIACRRKYQNILVFGFSNLHEIQIAVKQGFETSLNDAFVVMLLVRFLDEQLKGGMGSEVGPDIIALYRHVADKDYFELLHRQQLASRLLSGKLTTEGVEAEKHFVSLLKCESGFSATSKMEAMFSDCANSCRFSAVLSDNASLRILTLGVWPLSAKNRSHESAVNSLPAFAGFLDLKQKILKEYNQRFQGRKLLFLFNEGSVDLKFTVGSSFFLLTVSPLQALILLLIEERKTCSFAELQAALITNGRPEEYGEDSRRGFIDDEGSSDESHVAELKRHLMGLYHSRRCRVLDTTASGNVVNDDDRFSINDAFEAATRSLRVPLAALKIKPVRSMNTCVIDAGGLEEARKHVIDSAIVRVMKSRKKLDHNSLISEIIRMTADRFQPSIGSIKSRLENLIEREFIKRSEVDVNTYDYVA